MAIYTKEQQFELIRDGLFGVNNLKDIDNQYEEVCLEAIENNPLAIRYVKNQTEKIKIEAVKNNGLAISYIENPTDEMKLEAIKSNPWSIQHIRNQTDWMKWECLKSNSIIIQHIENPTEDMKMFAINNNPWSIQHIDNPTEEMWLDAIKRNGWILRCRGKINNELCFHAFASMLKNHNNVKFDYENLKIQNAVFLISDSNIEEYINIYDEHGFLKDIYYIDNNDYHKVFMLSKEDFFRFKKYLIEFNEGNCFIVDNLMNLDTIKKLALTNNELIYLIYEDREKIQSLYNILANKFISTNNIYTE